MKNISKIEAFDIAKTFVNLAEPTEDFSADTKEMVVSIIEKEIARLERVAEKDKARRAEKIAEGDELRELVLKYLGDNTAKSASMIAEEMQSDGMDITRNKVTARLTQLVNAGIITKEQGKVSTTKDGKKVTSRVMLYLHATEGDGNMEDTDVTE